LDEVDITGQIAGVFGSADSFYDNYGGAIDLMGVRLENKGATIVPNRLKVDLVPDKKDMAACRKFAQQICVMIAEKKKEKDA